MYSGRDGGYGSRPRADIEFGISVYRERNGSDPEKEYRILMNVDEVLDA